MRSELRMCFQCQLFHLILCVNFGKLLSTPVLAYRISNDVFMCVMNMEIQYVVIGK